MSDAIEYLVERLHTAFAEDSRVNELGIVATVVGRTVFLRGTVGTEVRRTSVTAVAREILPDFDIQNDCTVVAVGRPDDVESL